jgi:hypothetical protein
MVVSVNACSETGDSNSSGNGNDGKAGCGGFWAQLAQNLIGFIEEANRRDKIRQQNAKLAEAMQRATEVMPQPDEIFKLSQRICGEELKARAEVRDELARVRTAIEAVWRTAFENARTSHELLSLRLTAEAARRVYNSSGHQAADAAIAADEVLGVLNLDLVAAGNHLRVLESNLQQRRDCFGRARAADAYEDAVVELLAQIQALHSNQFGDAMDARLAALGGQLTAASADIMSVRAALKHARDCN